MIDEAIGYQIFSYDVKTNHVSMITFTNENSCILPHIADSFIVQSVSYTDSSDNISSEYAVYL